MIPWRGDTAGVIIAAVIAAWVLVAGALALLAGRGLAASDARDRWRDGRREVHDLRGLPPLAPVADEERPAA